MAGTNTIADQFVGAGKESTFGTAVAAKRLYEAESVDFQVEVASDMRDGFKPGRQTTAEDRFRHFVTGCTGSIEIPIYTRGMGTLLRSAFPSRVSGVSSDWAVVKSGDTNLYRGSYASDASGRRDSYTFEVARSDYDGDLESKWYTGCVCTRWSMSVPQGEAAMMTLEYAGNGVTSTAPSGSRGSNQPSSEWFHFADAQATIGTALTQPIRSFNLDCDFGLDTDLRYMFGTMARQKPQRSSIPQYTGTIEVEKLDDTFHDAWTSGSLISIALALGIEFELDVSGKTVKYTTQFEAKMPQCVITSAPTQHAVDALTSQSVGFRALHDDDGNGAVQVTYDSRDATEGAA